ncbi:MAG: BatA domain-containing protein [Gemmatimonadaceae bacterium]
MSFAAPAYLAAAALAAALVVALHLLVRRRPPSALLPTARFIPDVPASATALAARPADVPLLLLRVLVLLLVGAALAGPRLTPRPRGTARVVAVDVSRGASRAAALTAAAPHVAGAAAVIAFDSAARAVPADSLAALASAPPTMSRGSLSAALVRALRAASRLRESADSVQLVLVTPALAEEADAATMEVRALWPGRVDLVRTPPAGSMAGADSVLVEWADSAASPDWRRRARADVPGALRAGDAVLVAPLARAWAHVPRDSSRVAARWTDGEPAAVERSVPGGCVRELGFALPTAGDVALRPDAERVLARLRTAPCAGRADPTPMSDAAVQALAGAGRLARASDFPAAARRGSPLAPWLLGGALLLALAELPLRRARRRTSANAPASVERAA